MLSSIGWGIALVLMTSWTVYFVWTLKVNRSLRLFGLIPLMGALSMTGLHLAVIWGYSPEIGYRCRSIAWAAYPFVTLLFALSYPRPQPRAKKIWVLSLLALPPILSAIATDPALFAHYQNRPYPIVIVVWMAIYYVVAFWRLFSSLGRLNLPEIRHQVVFLTMGLIFGMGSHFIAAIVLPLFGLMIFWRTNFIWIIGANIFGAVSFVRLDLIRWRLRSESRKINQQIESMTDGAKILAHIMKNHLFVIDYLAAQAEEGNLKKIAEIRKNCQDVSGRLNEIGLNPASDSISRTVFPAEKLFAEIDREQLPENQRFEKNIEQPLPCIEGSVEQLRLAIHHLITNASESMKDGGEIRIEAQREGDYLVIQIADRGVGIPQERLKKIFRPFTTSKSLYESWGLGLSFVQQVMAAHQGGQIVRSRPGEGTAFIVFIPIHAI